MNENLSSKYGPVMLASHQKLLDDIKKSATYFSVIQKTAEVTSDLIRKKIAY